MLLTGIHCVMQQAPWEENGIAGDDLSTLLNLDNVHDPFNTVYNRAA